MKMVSNKKGMRIKTRKAIVGALFTLPLMIGLVWFFLLPVFSSVRMAFSQVQIAAGGLHYVFWGLPNFNTAFFEDAYYNQYLVQSIISMCTSVPVIIMFSFLAATLINQKFKGKNIARVIFFLPIVLASSAMMSMDVGDVLQASMRDSSFRAIGSGISFLQNLQLDNLLSRIGLPANTVVFLSDAVNNVYQIISQSGVQILIILAALQSVSPSLFEAARVEGATAWESFWLITFPMISPILVVCIVYTIIDSFTAYNNFIIAMIKQYMISMNYGVASAMAWIYFVIIIGILGIVMLLISPLRKKLY